MHDVQQWYVFQRCYRFWFLDFDREEKRIFLGGSSLVVIGFKEKACPSLSLLKSKKIKE